MSGDKDSLHKYLASQIQIVINATMETGIVNLI
jgi:hypothetical protein